MEINDFPQGKEINLKTYQEGSEKKKTIGDRKFSVWRSSDLVVMSSDMRASL